MKVERLIGILTILLQKEKVTTLQLAERFEVSSRTIQRDIDDLCKAGIPVVSMPGYKGGVSIADGYRLDKTVLTEGELQAILAGTRSIDSILKTTHSQTLIEKFSNGKSAVLAGQDKILIDLASWHQSSLSDKIEQIKQAIFDQEQISFVYSSDKGESFRTVEPYLILFKWAAWYLYGYDPAKNDYRLFKLNRLWSLQSTGISFRMREIPKEKLDFDHFFKTEKLKLVAVFQAGSKYRLIEEYGPSCFTVLESGKLLFERTFSSSEYALQWLLGFGDQVTVLKPTALAEKIREQAKNILQAYE